MATAGDTTIDPTLIPARRVEKYDPEAGCLAIRFADGWAVTFPSGVVLRSKMQEYDARGYAQFLNLTNDIAALYRAGMLPNG